MTVVTRVAAFAALWVVLLSVGDRAGDAWTAGLLVFVLVGLAATGWGLADGLRMRLVGRLVTRWLGVAVATSLLVLVVRTVQTEPPLQPFLVRFVDSGLVGSGLFAAALVAVPAATGVLLGTALATSRRATRPVRAP